MRVLGNERQAKISLQDLLGLKTCETIGVLVIPVNHHLTQIVTSVYIPLLIHDASLVLTAGYWA